MSTDPQNTKVQDIYAAICDQLNITGEAKDIIASSFTQQHERIEKAEAQNARLRELVRVKDEALTWLSNFHAPYWPMSVAEEALALTLDNLPTEKKGGAA